MSLSLFLSKQRLLYYRVLNDFLCDDIIQLLINYLLPIDTEVNQLKLINEITEEYDEKVSKTNMTYFDNIYEKLWILKETDYIKQIRKTLVNNRIHKFIKDEHHEFCGCDQCIFRIDYPRYMYLLRRCQKPCRGWNSVITNNWILFQSYISGVRGMNTSKHIILGNEIINEYGFVSKYDRSHNLIKKKKQETRSLENLRLRSDKGLWIQFHHIWHKINLL